MYTCSDFRILNTQFPVPSLVLSNLFFVWFAKVFLPGGSTSANKFRPINKQSDGKKCRYTISFVGFNVK